MVAGPDPIRLAPRGELRADVADPAAAPPRLIVQSVLDGIASLVAKHLLRPQVILSGEPRFVMFETIREFGLEALETSGEVEEIRRRHATRYVALMERMGRLLEGPLERPTRVALDAELANLRVALVWVIDNDQTELALRLTGTLHCFWFQPSIFHEGRPWAEEALALTGEADPSLRIPAMLTAAATSHHLGDFVRLRRIAEEMIEFARREGSTQGEAQALFQLSLAASHEGDHDEAVAAIARSVAIVREIGTERRGLAWSLERLGNELIQQGNYAAAETAHTEELRLWREVGYATGEALALSGLSMVARNQGDIERAAALLRESLMRPSSRKTPVSPIPEALLDLAGFALSWDQPRRAARLLGSVEALDPRGDGRVFGADEARNEAVGLAHYDRMGDIRAALLASAHAALGEEAFQAAVQEGRALSLEHAVEEALGASATAPEPGAAPPEPRATDLGLSPREIEIPRLLPQGLSNPRIADALFISPRTVQTHVQHIFTKLGVNTRAEAVRLAVKHGLV